VRAVQAFSVQRNHRVDHAFCATPLFSDWAYEPRSQDELLRSHNDRLGDEVVYRDLIGPQRCLIAPTSAW